MIGYPRHICAQVGAQLRHVGGVVRLGWPAGRLRRRADWPPLQRRPTDQRQSCHRV